MSKIQFENILHAPSTIFKLIWNVKKQAKFLIPTLETQIADIKNNNDGSLSQEDYKKITNYYGLAVPAILGEALCTLRGQKMTTRERMALTYQGAMTGLGDDFFDKQGTSEETVKSFIEDPESFTGETDNQRLFLSFYKKSLAYAHDPNLLRHYLRKVFIAQIESKKQATAGLTEDQIFSITLNKGGSSVLFYRAALSHLFINGEEEALNAMGGLMQFGNDIFDVYKDRNSNIHTLVTTATQIKNIRTRYIEQLEKSIDLTNQLSYSTKHKKKYLQYLLMSISSRCFVCLDQLEKNELTTDGVFMPDQYSREQLVCDMDTVVNKWNTVNKFIRFKF